MINQYYFVLLIAFIIPLMGCDIEDPEIKPSGKTIKIGIIGPMSGPEKALGNDTLEGIQTALHMQPYLNNGDAPELVVEDDQNIPGLTVKAFKKLVLINKVSAVILTSSSASALAINAIVDKYQVPVFILLATHQGISQKTHFVSQLSFDNTFQGKVAALYVRDEMLIDRVAVFKESNSYHSISLSDEFIRKFRSIEGQIIDVISITEKTNYKALLSQLRENKVQFIYAPVGADNVLEIAKELDTMDWSPGVMGGDGLLTNILSKFPDDAGYIEEFLSIGLYSSNIPITEYGKKAGKVFRSLFETRNSFHPAYGFEGMAILMDSMNRCQNPAERQCINTEIHNTVNFEGLVGKITIKENGKVLRPLIVNRIQNGKLEFIVKVY